MLSITAMQFISNNNHRIYQVQQQNNRNSDNDIGESYAVSIKRDVHEGLSV